MKRQLTVAALSAAFALTAFGGVSLADSEAVLTNPSENDAKAYCVTNHKDVFSEDPNAVGDATRARKGLNGDNYRKGGVAETACAHTAP